ncbi:hypothetical protein Acsp02_09460 [Actinoplanes sp. NBRC 103695]|nr:hypothetical protein Acsp02_09460 [Actinoplanes sp. NBRC 103695]
MCPVARACPSRGRRPRCALRKEALRKEALRKEALRKEALRKGAGCNAARRIPARTPVTAP